MSGPALNHPGRAPVFCAIDTADAEAALALARQVTPYLAGLKLGMEFFYGAGPRAAGRLAELGAPIFLDLKCHDIPNTVAGAIRGLMPLRPAFLTLHTQGGTAMMQAARDAAEAEAARLGCQRPALLGVTVLTSLDDGDLTALGIGDRPADQVVRLARLAQAAGLDGLVCSAHEIASVRTAVGSALDLVVPGIRPAGAATGDQKRVMTPKAALEAGATYLVIGRPLTVAADPGAAAADLARSLTPAGAS